MMNKKLVALFLSLAVMLTAFASSGYAAQTQKPASVLLDGTPVQMSDGQPFVDQGTTFVPMRALFKLLDIQVTWDSKQQTILGSKDNLTITLKIGSTSAAVNNRIVKLSAAPRVVNNVTYVPLRFVGEATGYKIGWTSSTHTITLVSPPKKAPSKGFLWKVEHNGNTVYLLGSIHVASEAMYPLRPEIEQAFKSADVLGVEIDITETDQSYVQAYIQKEGVYNDGTALKDHIPAETYKKLQALLQSKGLPPSTFDTFKPWYITLALPSFLPMQTTNYEGDLGIDSYLLQKAHESNKPVVALETMDLQLQMLSGLSEQLQETQLLETVNAYNQSVVSPHNTGYDMMAKMWVSGDEQTLVSLVTATAAQPEYYKALLEDRNVGMTDKVEGYLNGDEKNTYLIVVGALHMLGPDGIVTQLEQDGFKVDRL